jgi:energy-coupling factor transport system ATP-binding protein
MLCFDKVDFSYGGESVLRGLSFEMGEGEFAALLGENGAGKSTICRLCNGLLKPSSGTVRVGGRDTREIKTSVLSRSVGFLFQNPDRQLCRNTVREEIVFGLEYAMPGAPASEAQSRCDEMLELFDLEGSRPPFALSRGERQQVALASVLARRPPLLILDEPTTGLDYRECMNIMDIIVRLHKAGTTILMVSHDMEVVADFAERALVLKGGSLIADGRVRHIMKNGGLLEEASLLPAQIPALALRVGKGFEDVFTGDDMADTAEKLAGKNKNIMESSP